MLETLLIYFSSGGLKVSVPVAPPALMFAVSGSSAAAEAAAACSRPQTSLCRFPEASKVFFQQTAAPTLKDLHDSASR